MEREYLEGEAEEKPRGMGGSPEQRRGLRSPHRTVGQDRMVGASEPSTATACTNSITSRATSRAPLAPARHLNAKWGHVSTLGSSKALLGALSGPFPGVLPSTAKGGQLPEREDSRSGLMGPWVLAEKS